MPVRTKPTYQDYSQYTADDFQVWKTLFERQMAHLPGRVAQDYLDAMKSIGFQADAIPHIDHLNVRLLPETGWQLKVVPELVPIEVFLEHLSRRIFPVTCWLRLPDELDYLEEPDMFHDVFGHVPLLTNPDYATFFQALGALGTRHIDKPEVITRLYRLYWFTVEFGLVKEGEQTRIYGAGIVSSIGETQHALSEAVRHHPFDMEQIAQHAFRTDVMQNEYYIINSFDTLRRSVPDMERVMLADT